MKKISSLHKGVDKERTLFGLRGVFIIAFIGIFMFSIMLYLILSSFISPTAVFLFIGTVIPVLFGVLVRYNKKYGVHMIDIIMNQKKGIYFFRTGKKIKL